MIDSHQLAFPLSLLLSLTPRSAGPYSLHSLQPSAAEFLSFYVLPGFSLSLKCALAHPDTSIFPCLPICVRKPLCYAIQTRYFCTVHETETLRACSPRIPSDSSVSWHSQICITFDDGTWVTLVQLAIVLRLRFIQWERITASRIATIYFAFSILNCVLQVVFRAQAFSINVQADNFLSGLISTGNISLPTGFFVLDSELHFCDHLPSNSSTKSCQIVWGGEIGDTDNSTTSVTPLTLTTTVSVTSLTATPTAQALVRDVGTQPHHDKRVLPRVDGYRRTSSHGQTGVKLTGLEIDGKDITLDSKCLVNLMWPVQT